MGHIKTFYNIYVYDLKNNEIKNKYPIKNRREALEKLKKIVKRYETKDYICYSLSEKTVVCERRKTAFTSIIKIFYKKIKNHKVIE